MTNELTADDVRELVAAAERTNKGIDAAIAAQKGFNQLAWKHRHRIIALIEREKRLEEALVDHNDQLRSAQSVAYRDGADTNWKSLRGGFSYVLALHHETTNEARAALQPKETDDGRYC